jgi:hypothetical protein
VIRIYLLQNGKTNKYLLKKEPLKLTSPTSGEYLQITLFENLNIGGYCLDLFLLPKGTFPKRKLVIHLI